MASPGSVVIQFLVDAKKAASDAADLAKNFGKVDTEADKLDRTLDSLESELDSIGTASAGLKSDMEKAGVGFDSVGDEAEDTADRLRRAAADMADGVHDGGTKIDKETDGIRQSMGEAGKESGAEFIGNVAEGIGSGTATVNDVVQGTLGGLTNLAATLGGPLGLAVGAAAAGVGLVFGKVKAEAERAKEQAQELRDALAEVGDTSSAVAKQIAWDTWMRQVRETEGLLGKVTGALRQAGITGDQMQGAITGDPAAQQAVVDKLKRMGDEIAANVRDGKPLTEDQRRYLSNQGLIHEELRRMGISLDDIEDEHRDIEYLTGQNKNESSKWADEQEQVYNQTHKIKKELAGIKDQDVNVRIHVRGGGNIPSLGGGTITPAGLVAPMTMAVPMAAPPPAPPPPVIVTEEQVYRAVSRLLMRGDARNGRLVVRG